MANNVISGATIASFLCKPLQGASIQIFRPATIEACGPGDLAWIRTCKSQWVQAVEDQRPSLVICDSITALQLSVPCIISKNPRLDFIRIINEFFMPTEHAIIHPTAIISPGATLGEGVAVGAYCRIGAEVVIGDSCRIGSGVSIEGPVSIGARCRIKSNSVIGAAGFGFERDEQGVPMHFPHLGNVVLEDDVWIGACTTIERATLGTTRLCKDVKIDDLVQVGHNVIVGHASLVMANTVICGGAVIGRKCWIAPNSVIKEKVHIGAEVTIGLGSVVLRDVDSGQVVAGVPAKLLRR